MNENRRFLILVVILIAVVGGLWFAIGRGQKASPPTAIQPTARDTRPEQTPSIYDAPEPRPIRLSGSLTPMAGRPTESPTRADSTRSMG